MRKLFEIPEAEILKLSAEDVVYTSGLELTPDDIISGGGGVDGGVFNPGNDD